MYRVREVKAGMSLIPGVGPTEVGADNEVEEEDDETQVGDTIEVGMESDSESGSNWSQDE